MANGLNHFQYLIDEAQDDFFQKAAEEIGQEKVARKADIELLKLVSKAGQKSRKAMRLAESSPLKPSKAISEAEWKKILEKNQTFFGHGGSAKLAQLIYRSNQANLTKQASAELFNPDSLDSYSSILNHVAASSFWGPLGMSKSAAEYLDVLEDAGVEEAELNKLACYLIPDAIDADIVIEAIIEKQAGAVQSIPELAEELAKIAQGELGVLKLLRGAAPEAIAVGSRAARGASEVASLGSRAAKGLRRADEAVAAATGGTGKFQRLGKAIRKVPSTIAGKIRNVRSGLNVRKIKRQGGYIKELKDEKLGLKGQLESAGTEKAPLIGSKIKKINEMIGGVREKMKIPRQKLRNIQEASGLKKTRERISQKAKASQQEGASKAQEAASKAEETVKSTPKAEAPQYGKLKQTPGDKKNLGRQLRPEELRTAKAGTFDVETGRKIEPIGSRVDTSSASAARDRAAAALKTSGKPKGSTAASEEALKRLRSGKAGIPNTGSPASAPRPSASAGKKGKFESVENKPGKEKIVSGGKTPPEHPTAAQQAKLEDAGYMGSLSKWQSEGWSALSKSEKGKVLTALGGAFVAQRAVLGKEDRII